MEMLVRSESLEAVANAIREKGETAGQMVFPDGFVTAIHKIAIGKIRNIDFDLTSWTQKNPYPSREYAQGVCDVSGHTLKGQTTGSYQRVVVVKNEKIDFWPYDTLNFTYDLDKDLNENGSIIVKVSTSDSDPIDSTCVANRQIYDSGTDVGVSVDISSADSSYYLWIGMVVWGDIGTINFEISNLYLK